MKYERPEIFRIGRLEAHTFGSETTGTQDSCDTYRSKSDALNVQASFRKARRLAVRG